MERVIERSAGLDVHKTTVAACVRLPGPAGSRGQEVRTFGTTVTELLRTKDRVVRRALQTLERQGYRVSLELAA